jgi:hypothetical protein
MEHTRIITSNNNSSNTIVDSHFKIFLGTVDEDQSHGKLSRESESDHTFNGCKFTTTPVTNIDVNKEYSRIHHTKTRTNSSLVHRMLHRREYEK